MDLFEAIQKRYSYRAGYVEKPVPREDLVKIVQAGIQAPSGCNSQSTSFVIVDDLDTINQIRELVRMPAPAVIACIIDPSPVYKGTNFALEDCSAAVENMLLVITALGYASVWLDGAIRGVVGEKIGQLLNVPEGKTVQVLLPIGIPEEQGTQRERKPFDERAWFNRYGD